MAEIVIPYEPRAVQRKIHDLREAARFIVIVAHRRLGKTVACINELIMGAMTCERERPRLAYIAPLYRQAKQAAWDYLKHYTAPIPGRVVSESELRVDLPNGSRVQLFGADNPDALRGIYLDGVVLDEYAQMSPKLWGEVIRPLLTDRQGWAMFIGTPKGHNAFYDVYESARADPAWKAAMFKASQTGVLPQDELEMARRDMSEDEYAQEFECSFEAAIQGAYYGKDMAKAEDEGRVGSVPWETAREVHTAWDLGIGDDTAIWFVQQVGREIHWIDYLQASGVGLDFYVRALRERPYVYGKHYLPHDAKAKELGSGKSREETLVNLGLRPTILAQHRVDDGINAVRLILNRSWWDRAKCHDGIEAMKQYRRAWDEVRGVFKPHPLHDQWSHGADAARYAAMGLREDDRTPRRQLEPLGAGGWMA